MTAEVPLASLLRWGAAAAAVACGASSMRLLLLLLRCWRAPLFRGPAAAAAGQWASPLWREGIRASQAIACDARIALKGGALLAPLGLSLSRTQRLQVGTAASLKQVCDQLVTMMKLLMCRYTLWYANGGWGLIDVVATEVGGLPLH